MKLSCTDYTFHLLPHEAVVDLVAAMGFDAIDLAIREGLYWLGPDEVRAETALWAGRITERVGSRGLAVGDVFFTCAGDYDVANGAWADADRLRARDLFKAVCEFAARVGSDGVTTLPGVEVEGTPRTEGRKWVSDELAWRVEEARSHGLGLSVEFHVTSVAPTPDEALELLDLVPGLQTTLDHSHFVAQGLDQSSADVLIPSTRAVQMRTACDGRLQAPMTENTIDWQRVVDSLVAGGYDGYLTCEFVWQPWQRCDECDTVSETVMLRDVIKEALARR